MLENDDKLVKEDLGFSYEVHKELIEIKYYIAHKKEKKGFHDEFNNMLEKTQKATSRKNKD